MNQAQRIAADLLTENLFLREQMAAALAVVEQELPEACYHAETLEYFDDPCLRCVLRAFLSMPDVLTLDVIAARSTQPNGRVA